MGSLDLRLKPFSHTGQLRYSVHWGDWIGMMTDLEQDLTGVLFFFF